MNCPVGAIAALAKLEGAFFYSGENLLLSLQAADNGAVSRPGHVYSIEFMNPHLLAIGSELGQNPVLLWTLSPFLSFSFFCVCVSL